MTEWTYYNSDTRYKGLLKEVNINGTQERTIYTYDPQTRRLVESAETVFNRDFSPTRYTYYDNGKVESIIYPTGYSIKKTYTETGHLGQITGPQGNNLWKTIAKNSHGQITNFVNGSDAHLLTGVYKYYSTTNLLEEQTITDQNEELIHHFWYKYDKFGNLARRTTDRYWIGEFFEYDELNRLTQSRVSYHNQDYISDVEYDDNNYGSIKSKTAAYEGAPAFVHASYGTGGRPHAIDRADIVDGSFPTDRLSTEYNSFDKLSHITQYNGNGDIDRELYYQYGYDHQRIYMLENEGQAFTYVKTYVGNCEYIYDHGTSRTLTYLSGPLGVFAVFEQVLQNDHVVFESLHYLFTDHLGSITTIVNDKGEVEQRLSYDAWGNLRNPKNWSSPFEGTPMFDRGFTGHEHLYGFGLINMNGRMYDPVLGSFLSPDNYIQSPDNSQSFNRYAYCLNNPLRYVDLSGEFLTWSINQHGFSIGLNFTPAFCPLGFGINVSWANGGSFGLYGEVGFRVGGKGLGMGAGLQQSLNFNLTNLCYTTSSAFAYGSIGLITASGMASYSYDFINKQGTFGWNVGLSASVNPTMPYGEYGQSLGVGMGLSYGSDGWGFGINGYYQGLSAQDKLDILVSNYKSELEAIGEADATFEAKRYVYSNNELCNATTKAGSLVYDGIDDNLGHFEDNRIIVSYKTIRQAWRGNLEATETLFHEWKHGTQLYSGEWNEAINLYGKQIAQDLMEVRAYAFDYNRIHTQHRYNRMMYYAFKHNNNQSIIKAFLIDEGLMQKP